MQPDLEETAVAVPPNSIMKARRLVDEIFDPHFVPDVLH
jgi:hypothetical protein